MLAINTRDLSLFIWATLTHLHPLCDKKEFSLEHILISYHKAVGDDSCHWRQNQLLKVTAESLFLITDRNKSELTFVRVKENFMPPLRAQADLE